MQKKYKVIVNGRDIQVTEGKPPKGYHVIYSTNDREEAERIAYQTTYQPPTY